MKITVTAKHIKNGKPQDSSSCPIGLALREQFLNEEIYVGISTVDVGSKFFGLSTRARSFVRKFDFGLPVKPFTFNLK